MPLEEKYRPATCHKGKMAESLYKIKGQNTCEHLFHRCSVVQKLYIALSLR